MSKAFTREQDDLPEQPVPRRPASALPPGATNYMTADGARRLRQELERLVGVERPRLAGAGGDSDAKRQLQALDERIHQLRESLVSAEVVNPADGPVDEIRLGATVTIRDPDGEERYRIVGVDEADADRGWISWCSPLAKALLNARAGQRIRFRGPAGELDLEIVRVEYG
ncbi:GreA/GreB family elongation factor [bacterium]|nr:GreA/GreB family elongation factor [bacterium]